MKAVVVYEPGGSEALVYTDVPRPMVKDGWSLVRVRGGASGVGIAFLRLLRAQFPQMSIVGTTRRAEMGEQLHVVGYSDVVTETNGTLDTEEQYDRILDLVGPSAIKDSMQHLRCGGVLCSTGQLGGKWFLEEFDPIVDLAEDAYLRKH